MRFFILFFITVIFLGVGCLPTIPQAVPIQGYKQTMQRITLQTPDGVTIVGDFTPSITSSTKGVVLLLHMMPADRTSWKSFIELLSYQSFASLAIDLRGHGESIQQKGSGAYLDYRRFTDAEHQKSIQDVEVALQWLQEKNFSLDVLTVIGASVGANLASELLAVHHEIPQAVMLSPGLEYRGISADTFIQQWNPSQAVYLAASEEDGYSFDSIQKLYTLAPGEKIKREFKDAGHGTQLLLAHPELGSEIIHWMERVVGP